MLIELQAFVRHLCQRADGVSLAASTLAAAGPQTMGAVKLHWTLALILAGMLSVLGAGLTMIAPPAAKQTDAQSDERNTEQETPRTDLYGDPLPPGAIVDPENWTAS